MLATEATALLHGRAAADAGRRDRAPHLRGRRARRDLPTVEIAARRLEGGHRRARPPSSQAGLVASNGEARRQIKGGGLKVNDVDRHRREDDADAEAT